MRPKTWDNDFEKRPKSIITIVHVYKPKEKEVVSLQFKKVDGTFFETSRFWSCFFSSNLKHD